MEAQLKELLPFLHDRNPQVRQIALSNLLGQTPQGSPCRMIFFTGIQGGGLQKSSESDFVRDLKLLCRDQLAVAHDAFRALVNLSDQSLMVTALSDPPFLQFLVSYILNSQAILADLASMLLSNLSVSSTTCATLLSMLVPVVVDPSTPDQYYPTQSRSGTCPSAPAGEPKEFSAVALLINAFTQGALVDETQDVEKRKRKGQLHFLASVFANLTTAPLGRTFFLTPRPAKTLEDSGPLEYPLAKIVVFTEHKDMMRRGGVISTIKNCAFHPPSHRALLSPDNNLVAIPPSTIKAPGVDILSSILLPLAGPEEFDLDDIDKLPAALQLLPPTKKRESDSVIRLTLVETLLLLCSTRWGRDFQRENGVYEIIRATHENETDDKVAETIERLVNMLKRDEGSDPGESSGIVEMPDEDDDDKIEEI